jgi:acetyltransferase-like isoleucine patch superfamily enzyme
MKYRVEIRYDQYTDIEYRQWDQSATTKRLMKMVGWLSLPLIYPLVGVAKLSPEAGFRTISELLSLIPFAIGIVVRYEFYRRTLRACGQNVFISFGTVFYYPEISIGNNVLIGMYNTIHHCDFGDHVMTAEGCRFLSGSKYHNFSRIDIPMARQGGRLKRIRVGHDIWIGANAVVMEEVGQGSIVGASSVVTQKVEPYSIVAGNPAKVLRKRLPAVNQPSASLPEVFTTLR